MVSRSQPIPTADLRRLRDQLAHADAALLGPIRASWWTRTRAYLFREDRDVPAACLAVGRALELGSLREDELVRALGRLAFRDRRVLELAYVHHATVGEVAAELGVDGAGVGIALRRALERLRDRLEARR